MSGADEYSSLQEGNVIRDGDHAPGAARGDPVHIRRNALLGAVFVLCLLASPICLVADANTAGADDGPGSPDTLLVWDIGQEYRFLRCISGHYAVESFIPSRDLEVGAVTVPAGSVPDEVNPVEAGWTVTPAVDGYHLL